MQILKPIRRLARAARKYELTWRYAYNLAPTLRQKRKEPPLTGEAARVLADLNRDGIAISSVQALLGKDSPYAEMLKTVKRLELDMAGEIERARESAADETTGKKTFMLEYLGRNPAFDPASIYARLAVKTPLLRIANAYLGMYTRLRYYNIWHTFATQSKPRESQLWHRDREDLYILKVFIYLKDVDLGAGPFTYAPGTHRKGAVKQEPEYFLEGRVKRTEDDHMAAVVPRDQWKIANGPAGTIIFADTNGYHRGGLARTSDRVMYTCMYTSKASESEEFFIRSMEPPPLNGDAESFALNH
ncbi:MAG: phytanoyl-CoA dioxygenase family protein [Gemmatimonadaceae bacterium]